MSGNGRPPVPAFEADEQAREAASLARADAIRECIAAIVAWDRCDVCAGTGVIACWSPGGPCCEDESGSCECCGGCTQCPISVLSNLLPDVGQR